MADAYEIYNMSHTGEEIDAAVNKANAAVPRTRTVNGKALSADITLSAKDVGALVKSNLLDFVYPVGSIYMSAKNVSPNTFLGGTWTQIQGRFLLAAGSAYPAGSTGGEATHKLTINEMPIHTHYITASSVSPGDNLAGGVMISSHDLYDYSIGRGVHNTGGDQPHNNMPPYLAVYMWQRTA